MMFKTINGMAVYESNLLIDTTWVRHRKHKKKRTDKKWEKAYGYKKIDKPSNTYYVIEDRIMIHPQTLQKLIEIGKVKLCMYEI